MIHKKQIYLRMQIFKEGTLVMRAKKKKADRHKVQMTLFYRLEMTTNYHLRCIY